MQAEIRDYERERQYMRRLLISLTLAMMVLPTAAWSMVSLVSTTNSGFETGFQASGIANGWEAINATPMTCAGESAPANVHQGTWSQKVATTGTGVKAKFNTLPGLCKVSVWVKAPVGVAKFAVMTYQEVLLDPEPVLAPSDYMTNTSSGWQKLTKTVVAKRVDTYIPASGTIVSTDTVVVVCATYGGTAYFDEVTVEPVGEHTQPHEMWYTDGGGSPFLIGGVFDGNVILGRILGSPAMYWDCVPWLPPYQPLLHQTPTPGGTVELNPEQTSKCATIIRSDGHDYIYCTTGYGDIQQSVDWGALGPIIKFNNAPALRSKLNKDASAIVTDGTYLYCQDDNLGANAATNTIYKFAVNHAGGGSIVNAGGGFPVTITGYSQFLGICYWNGKIYAAEGFNGGQIFEIDCGNGAVTPLLTAPNLLPNAGPTFGQIARYGDKIFVGTASGHLYTWQLIAGTWTLVSGYDLHMDHPYYENLHCLPAGPCPLPTGSFTKYVLGLGVKGNGTNARGAWVTTVGTTRYYDLYPATVGDLGNVDFNSGLPAWVGNAVITALGPGTGFWIENQGRTAGAWVPTTEVPTVGNLVSIKGTPSKSASGERTLTPLEAIVQGAAADPVLMPLTMTNKTLGLATGGVGLATDGMLVKISGKVSGYVEADNFAFYIDDGSGVLTGIASPAIGVKVMIADGNLNASVENFETLVHNGLPCTAVVTGTVRLDVVGGNIVRRIDARSAADIVLTAL